MDRSSRSALVASETQATPLVEPHEYDRFPHVGGFPCPRVYENKIATFIHDATDAYSPLRLSWIVSILYLCVQPETSDEWLS